MKATAVRFFVGLALLLTVTKAKAAEEYSLRDGTLWNGSRLVLQKVPSGFAFVANPAGAGAEKPPRVVETEGKPFAFKHDVASGRLSATLPAAGKQTVTLRWSRK